MRKWKFDIWSTIVRIFFRRKKWNTMHGNSTYQRSQRRNTHCESVFRWKVELQYRHGAPFLRPDQDPCRWNSPHPEEVNVLIRETICNVVILYYIYILFCILIFQLYPPTEQASASSYSSAPSTPVSSPPPIAPSAWLTNHNTPHSPHYTQAVTVNNTVAPQGLHMVSKQSLLLFM